MNRWAVTVTGVNGERDQIEVGDVGDLARTVGAAVVSGAVHVEINAGGVPLVEFKDLRFRRDAEWMRLEPGCPIQPCDWGTSVINLKVQPDDAATDLLALVLGLVEHLQEDHGALLPGSDEPTSTPQALVPMDQYAALRDGGYKAAIFQWEARWAALRDTMDQLTHAWPSVPSDQLRHRVNQIEERIPTGKPVGDAPPPSDTIGILRLPPERISRLVQVLRAAGAHPSGIGSYEAAADALELADDIANMVADQMGFTQ